MKKIIPYIIVLAAGFALGIYYQKQPEAKKIETKVQTAIEQAGADVKEGEKKTDAAATEVKEGAKKADDMATNVVGQVKTGAQKIEK